ncbi:L-aspartate dehydrogenase [Sporosarcina sp. NCCP-2222]|uniref:aspartate dehydrogenase n=1 Tax=Sporosarcina sp. NCCP-2222 TaxID=2935073 RepID=UPI002082F1F9|nr:aspartate dehydrogenase [Sporosarcina sp. NCCP-2222]GKV56449.1 L-aspartate dehydrogenase [Sporosarcina sp. NCCP-2222]
MKIGIIGTGNIATHLLEVFNIDKQVDGKVVSLFGRNNEAGERLKEQYGVAFYTDFQAFLQSSIDIVVEAATVEAAVHYMKQIVENKKDLIVSSIGALKDDAFLQEIRDLAKRNGVIIYLPSGAIGGLDLLQSANAIGGLREVRITTKKSPRSLGMESIEEAAVIFEGSARAAIERFPRNVNVALLLSLAGLGSEKTMVRVIADPDIDRNTHCIEAAGDFGEMRMEIENKPMPSNPKTSYLAALSIISTLKNKGNAVRIGR